MAASCRVRPSIIKVPYLLAYAGSGSVTLAGTGNKVDKIAGKSGAAPGFSFTNSADITVGSVGPLAGLTQTGIFANDAPVTLSTTGGNLLIDTAPINAEFRGGDAQIKADPSSRSPAAP